MKDTQIIKAKDIQIIKAKDIQIIKAKDIQRLLKCSYVTSYDILKDIKKEFKIRIVLYYHFKKYFKIL